MSLNYRVLVSLVEITEGRGMFLIGFFAGCFVGANIGFLVLAAFRAKSSDPHDEAIAAQGQSRFASKAPEPPIGSLAHL